jgi:hypothetical protein
MLSCKEVTQWISESLDQNLPLRLRIGVKMHLLMCRFCSRYRRQMLFLRDIIHHYSARVEDTSPTASLPPEARERIKRALRHEDQ